MTKCRKCIASIFVCAIAWGAISYATTSPYAGQEDRTVEALSASEVADLLAGKGMGFAKAAELNGYPGPSHVLELVPELKLSQQQFARTQANYQRMQATARLLGAELVQAEHELDSLFRSRTATPELLARRLERIAEIQSKVREAHLKAHIEQTDLMSAEQVSDYFRLRGYAEARSDTQHNHQH